MGPLEPALAGEIGGFISDQLGTVKLRPQVGIPTTILSLATPEKVQIKQFQLRKFQIKQQAPKNRWKIPAAFLCKIDKGASYYMKMKNR